MSISRAILRSLSRLNERRWNNGSRAAVWLQAGASRARVAARLMRQEPAIIDGCMTLAGLVWKTSPLV